MPLPKIKGSNTVDVMKADDGNDSLDTFIRQAIGKEPFLSFPRANDSPVQWIQLLHALDQQDLPGWPLLSPMKVQMQKCDKCSREFCSTINYRRHMRLHRRNLNFDKDSTTKNRGLLQAFWDKLSMEETMEIMSLGDVSLEGVAGSSIVKALTSFIRKPGFTSLPQSYIRAGSVLLDIVQARPSRFPISSQELFNVLDDASENTFLCAGTAESLQKYVFDGEAGKIGLEMRNLVACTSFLVEQKLVKACLADKDAEALRYQKLLVEEEEAAQKRQAALMEKKRLKKLRQKEQRAKEQSNAETYDLMEDSSPSPPSLDSTLESDIPHCPASSSDSVKGDDNENHEYEYPDLGTHRNIDNRTLHRSGRRHMVNSRWQAQRLQRNGFHGNHNYQKLGATQKHVSYRDSRIVAATNGGKVWAPKPKSETDEESCIPRSEAIVGSLPSQNKKCEVLIGSISVTLGSRSSQQRDGNLGAPESSGSECPMPNENDKIDALSGTTLSSMANRSTVHLWRPVSRHENEGKFSEVGIASCDDSSEVQLTRPPECPDSSMEGEGGLRFSSHVVEAFLAKRWKEAVASDHVKLVLFPEPKPPPEVQEIIPSSRLEQRSILGSTENRLTNNTALDSSAVPTKSKIRPKHDKGSKVKYIPKQRSTT